jgi:hypothetical protein
MVNFKTVNNSDAGTAVKHGGNDVDRYSQLLNGQPDIAPNLDINTQMRIRSGRLELRNAANSFSYKMVGSALAADRNLFLPLLTGDDTLVTLNLAQELTNKVISGASNTITDIPDSALPAGMVYQDMPSTFSASNTFTAAQKFDTYTQIKAIAAPANPTSGFAYLYLDTADNKYKIKKSDGSEIDLEAIGAGTATDDRVMIREAGTIVGTQSRKLNFTVPTDFDLSEDAANDEIELKIADNAINDALVAAHTSTKLTITDKTHLNTNITYKDENDWLTDTMIAPHTTTKIATTSKSLLNSQIGYKDEIDWVTSAMIAGTIAKAELPASILYNDVDNALGAHYLDFAELPNPAAPSANTGRLWFDDTDEHLKIIKSDTTVVDLESGGAGGGGGGLNAGGQITLNGTASATVFTIPHGLGQIPDFISVEAASDDALGEFKRTKDATNITITYAVPPPTGTGNLKFEWGAGLIGTSASNFSPTSTHIVTNKTYQDALFSTYFDMSNQGSAPANPSTDRARFYIRDIDANNQGLFAKVKKAGAFVEVQIF